MKTISGLYAVTPDTPDSKWLQTKVREALLGGAKMLQYRNKTASKGLKFEQANQLRALCSEYGALLFVNDDIELALAVEADGAHIGRHDLPLAEARTKLSGKLLGVSCYNSVEIARAAQKGGADYAAFGSFFASKTKPDAACAHPGLLHEAKSSVDIALVAIGGVTLNNAGSLIEARADALAVVSALFAAENTRIAAENFCKLFTHR